MKKSRYSLLVSSIALLLFLVLGYFLHEAQTMIFQGSQNEPTPTPYYLAQSKQQPYDKLKDGLGDFAFSIDSEIVIKEQAHKYQLTVKDGVITVIIYAISPQVQDSWLQQLQDLGATVYRTEERRITVGIPPQQLKHLAELDWVQNVYRPPQIQLNSH